MKITGTFEVILDGVDVEQSVIRNTGSLHSSAYYLVDAAKQREDVQRLVRYCEDMNHVVELFSCNALSDDKEHWMLVFKIRPLTQNEIIAKESGL